jgi:hypothetical protein
LVRISEEGGIMNSRRTIARGLTAVTLCSLVAAQGCAASRAGSVAQVKATRSVAADRVVIAEYVQKLPPGAAVRIERARGSALRGTLLKATEQSLIVQPRTRLPEAPVQVPLTEVLSVVPESPNGTNLGKAIGIGVAAGAGAALGVFLIIIAALGD